MGAARMFLVAVAATALVAAGCGDDGSGSDAAGPEVPDADGESDGSARDDLPEPPEGAVAVVDGEEISEEAFEEQYEQVRALPAIAEQLQGPQGEAAEPMLRAQVLSQLVVSDILFRAAEDDFGIEITDEEVQARLEELRADAGSEEELARALDEEGITEELLVEQELPFVLLIEEVRAEVAGDDAASPPSPPDDSQQPSEAELALQGWVTDAFSAAEVSVRSEIGTWDPQSGQVQPPGGTGGLGQPRPAPQPQPAP